MSDAPPLPIGPPIILTEADYQLCLGSRELLPCPFCGYRYPLSHGESTPNGMATRWTIQCGLLTKSAPGCCASVWNTDRDQAAARAGAVAKWNRQPAPPAGVPELIEALRGMVESASPHPTEHPTMFAAWNTARAVLARAEGRPRGQ
jgi:hypothetical protein